MAHEKVYGFCESKCKVEVPTKKAFDELNENYTQLITDKVIEIGAVPRRLLKINNTAQKTYTCTELENYKNVIINSSDMVTLDLSVTNDTSKTYAIKYTSNNQSKINKLGVTDGAWNGNFQIAPNNIIEIEVINID